MITEEDLRDAMLEMVAAHDAKGCSNTPPGGFCLHYRKGLIAFLAHALMVSPEQLITEVKAELEDYCRDCAHCQGAKENQESRE